MEASAEQEGAVAELGHRAQTVRGPLAEAGLCLCPESGRVACRGITRARMGGKDRERPAGSGGLQGGQATWRGTAGRPGGQDS